MDLYNKLVVGIFSREGDETYDWLKKLLLSPEFRQIVRDVRPVNISNENSGGSWRFAQEISQCSFCILYHSQTRGRLNITNVTDSLYDEELRDLSRVLGRKKVVVLVDDVENNDRTAWSRIALEQPLISELSGLLVVFYKNEKPVCSSGAEECTGVSSSYQRNTENESKKKIQSIRSLMRSGQTINMTFMTTPANLLQMPYGGVKNNSKYNVDEQKVRCLALIGCGILIIVVIIILCAELIH